MRASLATVFTAVALAHGSDEYGGHSTEYKTSVCTAPVVLYSTSVHQSICTTEKTRAPPPVTSVYTSITTYTKPGRDKTYTSHVPHTTTVAPSTYTSLTNYTTEITDTYSTTYYVNQVLG